LFYVIGLGLIDFDLMLVKPLLMRALDFVNNALSSNDHYSIKYQQLFTFTVLGTLTCASTIDFTILVV